MILKTKQKLAGKLISLAIMLCLALNLAVFLKVENTFAQEGVTCGPPPFANPCPTTTTPPKTSGTKTSGSTTKSTTSKTAAQKAAEKAAADLKKAQENYEKDPTIAANNKLIAEKQKKLEEAKKNGDQKAVDELNTQINNLKGQNAKSKSAQDKEKAQDAYQKTITTQKSKTDDAWTKAKNIADTKKTALDAIDTEIAKQQETLAGMSPDDPKLKAEQAKLKTLQSKKDAAQKAYDKAKADQDKKYEDKKAVDSIDAAQKPQDAPEQSDDPLSVATVPFPFVASPNAAHSFNVDDYLTISNEHGAYFNDGEHSSAVNFIIRAINIMVRVIGSVAMLILIIGGLILITAHGSEPMLEKGKDTIKYGLIGLVIALSSAIIIAFVNNFLSIGTTG